MFASILSDTATVSIFPLFLCTLASLVCGIGTALCYMFRSSYTKSFVCSLVLLPAIVSIIILMVNGNLGTSVAILGAFGLIRFRSVPGSAKDICAVFLAMALGLACGTGYIAFAFLFLLLIGGASVLLNLFSFGEKSRSEKQLKITIPENLEYSGLFDDLFARYTLSHALIRAKTTNMGSLYELTYRVVIKIPTEEKAFLDNIRCRNGNLPVVCGRFSTVQEEL